MRWYSCNRARGIGTRLAVCNLFLWDNFGSRISSLDPTNEFEELEFINWMRRAPNSWSERKSMLVLVPAGGDAILYVDFREGTSEKLFEKGEWKLSCWMWWKKPHERFKCGDSIEAFVLTAKGSCTKSYIVWRKAGERTWRDSYF